MKIAIEGCAHGELEKIYDSILHLETIENTKVDLLICCGDFQSTRNIADLRCMACPIKYQNICTFYKYYSGEKVAPILTIFIGGNHEASNYLQELPYGGWVAPNIYYMGYASVINVGGIRIGGISGIFKGHDFLKGHFEKSPYSEDTKRSVYHIRNQECFRLKQLTGKIDIFLSHDWPRNVVHYGDLDQLLRFKPYFRDDIFNDKLGSKPCEELLHHLKPNYWFAAHLHCKFAALVPHRSANDEKGTEFTKFLALDKCLPNRRFLQIVEISHDSDKPIELSYDLEWLTILHLTNHLLSIKQSYSYMPNEKSKDRWNFIPTTEEKERVLQKFDNNLTIPLNFEKSVQEYKPEANTKYVQMPEARTNSQTEIFCKKLSIDDPLQLILLNEPTTPNHSSPLLNNLTPEQDSVISSHDLSFNNSDADCSTPTKGSSLMFIPRSVESKSPGLIQRMNLPAPKDTSFTSDCDSTVHDISDSIINISSTIEDDSNNPVEENGTVKTRPNKVFKRRNGDIYQKESMES